jgi:hypothetical protein
MRSALVILVLLFCFSQTVYAIDASSVDSIAPLNTDRSSGGVQTLHLYTEPATVPSDIQSFITDLHNFCSERETTKSVCFKRILVSKPFGYANYIVSYSNLSCPQGYYVIAAMGNTAFDRYNPDQEIYYYDGFTHDRVTETQFNYYSSLVNATCGPPSPMPPVAVETGSSCISMGCEQPLYKTINGYYAIKIRIGDTYSRDTYIKYDQKCEAYTDAGCPDWCGRRTWEQYGYYYVTCSREAGFSLPDPAHTEVPSFKYSPTVVICGKPSTVWKPQATTP